MSRLGLTRVVEGLLAACVGPVLMLLLVAGCGGGPGQVATEMPSDFDFVLKYGITMKNVLDTSQGTFTKDLITAGVATTDLHLTPAEMQAIYAEMTRIDLASYPKVFAPGTEETGPTSVHTPFVSYYLRVTMDGAVTEVSWDDDRDSLTPEAKALRDMIASIVNLIEAKDEFKALPPAEGGYE